MVAMLAWCGISRVLDVLETDDHYEIVVEVQVEVKLMFCEHVCR